MHHIHHNTASAIATSAKAFHAQSHHHGRLNYFCSLLLFVVAAFLVFFSVQFWSLRTSATPSQGSCVWNAPGSDESKQMVVHTGSEFLSPLALPPAESELSSTQHLIIVPGHAVFTGRDAAKWRDSHNWALESFQRGNGDFLIQCFAHHVKKALQLLAKETSSTLLVFSGGQSRFGAGPRSEGWSYYTMMEEANYFNVFGESPPINRIFAEEFARDSYENVLFSVARFREIVGKYPERITIVGWSYKKDRFVKLHRPAIRFSAARFKYDGLDMEDVASLIQSEEGGSKAVVKKKYNDKMTFERDATDLYLCRVNAKTRKVRNPQRRAIPYFVSCPDLGPLLAYCGESLIPAEKVPWRSTMTEAEAMHDEESVARIKAAMKSAKN